MSVSAAALTPGGLTITLDLERMREDGAAVVRAVAVTSSRPVGFSPTLLVGRPADDVPGLVGRLHALCGRAHAATAMAAIAAARGIDDVAGVIGDQFDGLLAERLGEHLRSVFTGIGLASSGATVTHDMLADIRAVLASARSLDGRGGGPGAVSPAREAAETVCLGVRRLGLIRDRRGMLRATPGSWAASALGRVAGACDDLFLSTDALTAADDPAVIEGLLSDPSGFAQRPHLAGRCPESGPQVRAAAVEDVRTGRGRLAARLGEIAEAADLLADLPEARKRALPHWASVGALGERMGYAAMESPRGRLHHLVRLDEYGRVADYAILAPTEWNFQPEGPFVATLLANRFPPGNRGRNRVERIAALFDPCVGFDVVIRESANA